MQQWNLQPTAAFSRDAKNYRKKKPNELRAVLANLDRLMKVLAEVDDIAKVSCGFFKSEGAGLFRISEAGGGKVQPTRLYLTFKVDGRRIIPMRILPKGQSSQQSKQIEKLKAEARSTR
ncbi:hypothetical protein [Rosistilla oblonga]|uniref:hypothetical protein n=1 Tax=Rosistilla oblonga TaxID=2527990 RepID=UPI003A9701E6